MSFGGRGHALRRRRRSVRWSGNDRSGGSSSRGWCNRDGRWRDRSRRRYDWSGSWCDHGRSNNHRSCYWCWCWWRRHDWLGNGDGSGLGGYRRRRLRHSFFGGYRLGDCIRCGLAGLRRHGRLGRRFVQVLQLLFQSCAGGGLNRGVVSADGNKTQSKG